MTFIGCSSVLCFEWFVVWFLELMGVCLSVVLGCGLRLRGYFVLSCNCFGACVLWFCSGFFEELCFVLYLNVEF